MISYFRCVFWSLLLLLGCGASKYNSMVQPMVQHTLTIEANMGWWQPIGTGVALTKGNKKWIVSARHVLEAAEHVPLRACSIELPNECVGIPASSVQVLLVPQAADDDWGALPVKRFPRGTWGARLGGEPQIGDQIWVLGTPFGHPGEITQGIVTNKDEIGFMLDARCGPGNSGGPLFNHERELIGIVVAIANSPLGHQENMCLAIRIPTKYL